MRANQPAAENPIHPAVDQIILPHLAMILERNLAHQPRNESQVLKIPAHVLVTHAGAHRDVAQVIQPEIMRRPQSETLGPPA
jgi:hypothetical protein